MPSGTETWLIVTSLAVRLPHGRPAIAHYPRGATFGPRTVREFELVWMIAGVATWRRHDVPQELTLRPGSLLLVRPGMRDEFAWDPDRPSVHGYAHFSLADPTDAERWPPDDWPLVQPLASPGLLESWLSYLIWLGEEPAPHWRGRAEDVLSALLRAFVWGPMPARPGPVEPPALAAALDHVREQWTREVRPIPVEELAAAARVSKAHLSRLFSREFGVSPAAALELVRLERGQALLLRSNLSITDVARSIGFADPLHFSRRFRAVYGLSPRAYRSAGGGGPAPDQPAIHALARRVATTDPG